MRLPIRTHFRRAPGSRRLAVLGCFIVLALAGCNYSFVGGGLPRHIRTIAVLPFENETVQPLLETDIQRELQTTFPRSLGVRLADEAVADAVLRGRVVGYEEVAASIRPTDQNSGATQIPVVQRQVRITYDAEVYDLREDRRIWSVQGQAVTGNFRPDDETPEIGRGKAIKEIATRMVEGAQSQW